MNFASLGNQRNSTDHNQPDTNTQKGLSNKRNKIGYCFNCIGKRECMKCTRRAEALERGT